MERRIIHVDMDAFFAAVEVRDNPSLAGKPLIIGALPSERGVVSTCSYEARVYGVRSAMSIKEAYRRCPHGIYMHPNGHKYVKASGQIHRIWSDYTDLAEYVSLDEGYLDVTGSAHLFGGAPAIARQIKRRTKEQVGLTCSVGIGYNMMAAKLASEEKKPDGYFELLTPQALRELILDRDVRVLVGVGVKTAAALEGMGIRTVRDVLESPRVVEEMLGKNGRGILELAQGIDRRRVTTDGVAKSIGKENTFQEDITDFEYLKDALLLIARELSYEIHEMGIYGSTITLKITYANMQQITRSKTGEVTNRVDVIYRVAASLLDGIDRRPIRLVGISLSNLTKEPDRQISLLDERADEKREKIDQVAFHLQKRFGRDAIMTAKALKAGRRFDEEDST